LCALSDDPAFTFPQPKVPDLKAAIRRARIEEAERSAVASDLRGAELARLEMLRDALEPVYAQLPPGADVFDLGLVPGEKPRLFVDIVAHVELGRDGKTFRLLQELRSGRLLIAESLEPSAIVQAVTAYLGRRLAERERALAGDLVAPGAALPATDMAAPAVAPARAVDAPPPASVARSRRHSGGDLVFMLLLGMVLGAAALYGATVLKAKGTKLPFELPFSLPLELPKAEPPRTP
jgi:hypothetical protein